MSHQYQGAAWIVRQDWGELSPLGHTVAEILGWVFRGIYHVNRRYLSEVEWSDPEFMEIRMRTELATHDGNDLTELVLLAHLSGVRVAITPKSNWTYTLKFHAPGSLLICGDHPTLELAIARLGWKPNRRGDE